MNMQQKMAYKVGRNHYIASPLKACNDEYSISTPVYVSRSFADSDGEDSQRALSERTLSEYTSVPYKIVNDREQNHQPYRPSLQQNECLYKTPPNKQPSLDLRRGKKFDASEEKHQDSGFGDIKMYEDNHVVRYNDYDSDIYVTSGAFNDTDLSEVGRRFKPRAPSRYSYRSEITPSIASKTSRTSTLKTEKSLHKAGITVETMAAPNPFCPNIKGMCCLMLLLNLGIILVTLGFVIVIQFFEPVYIWVLGIVFLIFGFLTLIGSLIYCVVICREVKSPKDVNPDELYWTHYWSRTIGTSPSDVHYKSESEAKNLEDRYSDRYSVGKISKYSDKGQYSDREIDKGKY